MVQRFNSSISKFHIWSPVVINFEPRNKEPQNVEGEHYQFVKAENVNSIRAG